MFNLIILLKCILGSPKTPLNAPFSNKIPHFPGFLLIGQKWEFHEQNRPKAPQMTQCAWRKNPKRAAEIPNAPFLHVFNTLRTA